MPFPLLVAMILAFGLGDRAGPGPLDSRLARHRLYELGMGMAALAFLAMLLGGFFAWRIGRGHSGRPVRRGLLLAIRAVDLLALLVFVWALEWLEWPRIVSWNFGLKDWLLVDELVILTPFLVMQILGWCAFHAPEQALRPPRSRRGLPHHLGLRLRQNLGMLLPLAVCVVLGVDVIRRYFPDRQNDPWVQIGSLAVLSLILLVMAPGLVRLWWPTRPLPPGPLRTRLERLARRFRFRYTDILVWDTDGAMVNAVVAGSVPWYRYVLLTDAMIEYLDPEQIEAVFGHEIGHVVHRHLRDLALFIVGSTGVAALIELGVRATLRDGIWATSWGLGPGTAEKLRMVVAFGLLAGYFVAVFGWISRRFERQADVLGCRAVSCGRPACDPHEDPNASPLTLSPPEAPCPEGVRIFASALADVASLNGLPLQAPSWRHGSIARRILFVQGLSTHPQTVHHFQTRVRRLRLSLALGLIAAATLAWFLMQSAAPTR